MPGSGSPFSRLANDRKLTKEELGRAIRFMIPAEYEAIQQPGHNPNAQTRVKERDLVCPKLK